MKKSLSLLLVLVLVLGLAACGQTPTTPATATPAPAPTEPVDGEFVVSTEGHEGLVHVATRFKDGAITSVEVLTNDETVGVGSYAVSMYPSRIVEAQSVEVDAVTGATVTSLAIKRAVSEAIIESGHDIEAFSTEVTKDVTPNTVDETVDVVVMGAGTAGLVTASRLAEKGVNVLVFEKNDIPGGSAPMTYSGLMAAGSSMQLATDGEKAATPQFYTDYYKAGVVPEDATVSADLPFWTQIFNTSGSFVDWLQGLGVGFFTYGTHYGTTPFLAPGAYQGGAGYMVEYLAKHITDKGGRIIYGTPVTKLVQSEDGAVTGVVAEGKDGTTWNVAANAVVLCSGGFGANADMVAEYYPQYAGYTFNCAPGSTGDGITLGLAAGAGVECMGRTVTAFLSSYASKYELAFIHYTTPGIIVNINGASIGNIMKDNHGMLSAAKADAANGDTFYYVFDQASRLRSKKCLVDGLPYGVSYEPVFDKGEAVWYESVEAASTALNLPNLAATIDANNTAYYSGEADEWGRTNLDLIDARDGIWMLRVDPTMYLTTGGLACDPSGHILRDDRSVIANLYGAGDVLGSLEEKDGRGYAMGFDSALVFGYIVADTVMS
ncbi:MAG: FAD-dependent oxidoreductase, partial [Oscillospiraceae bacterium]